MIKAALRSSSTFTGALEIKSFNPIMAFKTPSVNGTKRLSSAYFVKPFRAVRFAVDGGKTHPGILIRFNFI